MVSKKVVERTENTFDLVFQHADFVNMMNDSDVTIDASGDVPDDQEFQILFRKGNGPEVVLKDMNADDILTIRFKKVAVTTDEVGFDNIDVS
jgi:hypothetical protein